MNAHICNAQFKYLKLRAIELQDKVVLLCSDDKAKVPFEEPGAAVSTAVRGKKSIVPTAASLVAMDHDMKKGSLVPSVNLLCEIPSSIHMSFVRGKVFTAVNDSVLQSANPFRPAAFTAKVLTNREEEKTYPVEIYRWRNRSEEQLRKRTLCKHMPVSRNELRYVDSC